MKISNKTLRLIFAAEVFLTGFVILSVLLWSKREVSVSPTLISDSDAPPLTETPALPSSSPTLVSSASLTAQTVAPLAFETASPTLILRPTAAPTQIFSAAPSANTPAFSEEFSIGQSVNQNPLTIRRFGNGADKRLILAGIHGGYEWNTTELAKKLILYIEAHPSIIPLDVTLYILPVFNIDGYQKERGNKGRANANGVDLNRNFGELWAAEWNREGCWNRELITAGSAPDSEPETRALEKFLLEQEIDALISYHSAALGIFAGGQPPDADSVRLAKALSAVGKYPYPPKDYGCEYTGQLIDWASKRGIAAVDIELSTHYDLDYEVNLKILKAFLLWKR